LGSEVLNLLDARSFSAHHVQMGRVFTLLVVLTFSINLSGVNSTKIARFAHTFTFE
jgi:hypothetical protein